MQATPALRLLERLFRRHLSPPMHIPQSTLHLAFPSSCSLCPHSTLQQWPLFFSVSKMFWLLTPYLCFPTSLSLSPHICEKPHSSPFSGARLSCSINLCLSLSSSSTLWPPSPAQLPPWSESPTSLEYLQVKGRG